MKRAQLRSDCPINFSLETFGDAWSLLILRDIAYFGKKTYGEFLDSKEGIARNILAARLVQLKQNGLITKNPHPDKRKDTYELTDKGLDLIPILFDLAQWGMDHSKATNNIARDLLKTTRTDREKTLQSVRQTLKEGGSIFSDTRTTQ